MSKAFALAAFNTAVIITNAGHAAKRCAVKAAAFTAEHTVAGAAASKEAGIAFWAGMKYAHQHNKANAAAAERLTPEDIAASQPKAAKPKAVAAAASQPKAAKPKAAKPKAAARTTKPRTTSKAKVAARTTK